MIKRSLFLFLLFSGLLSAQQIKPDLSDPYHTLFTHLYFQQPESYDLAKSALTIRGVQRKKAMEIAKKLKEIYDGRGLVVNFKNVPKDKNYVDSIFNIQGKLERTVHRYAPFKEQLPEVYLEKVGTRWYYSEETVKKVEKLYRKTFLWEFSWLEKHFPSFFTTEFKGIYIWKPLGLLILLGISFLLYNLLIPVYRFVLNKVQQFILHDSYPHNKKLILQIARPLVFITILYLTGKILPSFKLNNELNSFLFTSFKIATAVFTAYIFIRIGKLTLAMYRSYRDERYTKLDQQLEPILLKIMTWFVILIAFLYILTLFGVKPMTVLAGASIGGLALAFAAQDSVKNLIGTLMIFLDKPFQLGDWVEIGNVVGTVEKVGLRSTRVRAADTSVYQIPNSKVSEADINNKGLRLYRRYQTELGIRYDTPPELIQAFVNGIRKIVIAHPDTRSESYNVEFSGFGDSALLIMVNVFFKKLDWGSEQSSKHRLHMAIVRLAAALGVEFAFPSTTLMIEQLPGQASLAPEYKTDKRSIDKTIDEIIKQFKKEEESEDPHRSDIPDTFSGMEDGD